MTTRPIHAIMPSPGANFVEPFGDKLWAVFFCKVCIETPFGGYSVDYAERGRVEAFLHACGSLGSQNLGTIGDRRYVPHESFGGPETLMREQIWCIKMYGKHRVGIEPGRIEKLQPIDGGEASAADYQGVMRRDAPGFSVNAIKLFLPIRRPLHRHGGGGSLNSSIATCLGS